MANQWLNLTIAIKPRESSRQEVRDAPAGEPYVSQHSGPTMMGKEVRGVMAGVIIRIALLIILATFVGLLLLLVSDKWSAREFGHIQIMMGAFLGAFSVLKSLTPKQQFAEFSYWLLRSAGFSLPEDRPPHDFQELFRVSSGPLILFVSGLLTIVIGLGICLIYG